MIHLRCLGDVIFDRMSSNKKLDVDAGAQKRFTYEEAIEEVGEFDSVVVSVCNKTQSGCFT